MVKTIELTDEQFEQMLLSVSVLEAKKIVEILNRRIKEDVISQFDLPLEELDLPVKLKNSVKKAGINSVKELIAADPFFGIPGIGWKSVDQIQEAIDKVMPK